jgi:hypothetical protein
MQTTLRSLADLVRRRRWEAAQAGISVPASRMVVSSELGHVAVSGEGTAGPDGAVDSSVLRHPALQPERLAAAAEELFAEEIYSSVALENDPSPSRAHASWHGCSTPAATAGAPVEIRAGMLLRDTTAAGPRRVCEYAVLVAIVGYLFAAFLAGDPWPFGAASRARLGAIADAGAVISVLLLVPASSTPASAWPTEVHLRAAARAAGGGEPVHRRARHRGRHGGERALRGWVQLVFATMVVLRSPPPPAPVPAALDERDGRAGALGAPHWLDGTDVSRVRADARFFSVLGGAR